MFDGTKITLKGEDSKRLQAQSGFRLIGDFDKKTGHQFVTARGKFPGFFVRVNRFQQVTIHGSLHVFYNETQGIGPTNADQFTYEKCCKAIVLFCDLLGFEPNDLPITSLEFGLNLVNPIILVSEFIKRALLLDTSPFEWWEGRIGKNVNHSDYGFKFYDKVKLLEKKAKGLKNRQQKARILKELDGRQILRVEFRSERKRGLKAQGVESLADLFRVDIWKSCFSLLESHLDELIFAHAINERKAQKVLTPAKVAFLAESKDIDYWANLKSRQRTAKTEQLYNLRIRFQDPPILPILADQIRITFAALFEPFQLQKSVVFPHVKELPENSKSVVFPSNIDYHWKNDLPQPPPRPHDPLSIPAFTDLDQVEADQDSGTCKQCPKPIGKRGSSARYCSGACKRQWEAKHKRRLRRSRRYGNAAGRLFDGTNKFFMLIFTYLIRRFINLTDLARNMENSQQDALQAIFNLLSIMAARQDAMNGILIDLLAKDDEQKQRMIDKEKLLYEASLEEMAHLLLAGNRKK